MEVSGGPTAAYPVSYLACAAYPVSYFPDTGRTPRGGGGRLGKRWLKFPALRALCGACGRWRSVRRATAWIIVDVLPERPEECRSLSLGWLVVMVAVSIGRHGWRSVDDELQSENQ